MMRDVVDVDDVDDVIAVDDQQVDTSTSKSIFSWDLKCWKRDEEEFRVFLQLWLQLKFSPHIVQCCLSLTHLLLSLSLLFFPQCPRAPYLTSNATTIFPTLTEANVVNAPSNSELQNRPILLGLSRFAPASKRAAVLRNDLSYCQTYESGLRRLTARHVVPLSLGLSATLPFGGFSWWSFPLHRKSSASRRK